MTPALSDLDAYTASPAMLRRAMAAERVINVLRDTPAGLALPTLAELLGEVEDAAVRADRMRRCPWWLAAIVGVLVGLAASEWWPG
jgi:hypothetical protein